ncbi:MAG: UDP-N-acetylmuramate--L-alanine ligase [Sphingomonadales bacterium]
MIRSLQDITAPYFIGIAGTGMSALAQYLQGIGIQVAGSDRQFVKGAWNEVQIKLSEAGIRCFEQDGHSLTSAFDVVIVSTAIEDTVVEVQQAKQLGIPILHRAALLALIAASKKTIAIAGTSGKSTTSAMLFDILEKAGYQPGIISGAGLVRIIEQGKIGNAVAGKGEWLVIEADESDGSIVQYHPHTGVLLNIDKDHEETDKLLSLFTTFRHNCEHFLVNRTHPLAATLSLEAGKDCKVVGAGEAENTQGAKEKEVVGYRAQAFSQTGMTISFLVNDQPVHLQQIGQHNMENALAAMAVAHQVGVPLTVAAAALAEYKGIYRRHQVWGQKKGVWLIDDYAHNPVKCAAAIRACQPMASKVIAWFQPHGFKPTRFLRNDFVQEFAAALRSVDEIWMSEIYYAGGAAVKDISAADLIEDLQQLGVAAFFVANRAALLANMRAHFSSDCVLLLMGARDPSLETFAREVWEEL